jgi:hypothetical protein
MGAIQLSGRLFPGDRRTRSHIVIKLAFHLLIFSHILTESREWPRRDPRSRLVAAGRRALGMRPAPTGRPNQEVDRSS